MITNEDQNILHHVGSEMSPKVAGIVDRVWQLAEPLCLGEGMELVHVAYRREPGGRTLRLFLDKPGGVTLDDCAGISRQLSDILDVGLEIEESYRMEVSSPGLKRPLSKVSDFDRFKGRTAKVRSSRPIEGQKNFTGVLDGIKEQSVALTIGDRFVNISLADIVSAHLIQHNGETACS